MPLEDIFPVGQAEQLLAGQHHGVPAAPGVAGTLRTCKCQKHNSSQALLTFHMQASGHLTSCIRHMMPVSHLCALIFRRQSQHKSMCQQRTDNLLVICSTA